MAHHSRIAGFRVADDAQRLQELAQFWGAGSELPLPQHGGSPLAARLCPQRGEWQFSPCPLGPAHPPQLEIETDDIEAEAARLEERGAKRIGHLRDRFWMLEAPGGERLRVANAPLARADAVLWT